MKSDVRLNFAASFDKAREAFKTLAVELEGMQKSSLKKEHEMKVVKAVLFYVLMILGGLLEVIGTVLVFIAALAGIVVKAVEAAGMEFRNVAEDVADTSIGLKG